MADKDEYSSPLMQLVVNELKKNKKAEFADIKAVAEKKGLNLFPITYGRAKGLLGLVKVARRGTGKAARAAGAKRGPGRPRGSGKRGPGRPPKFAPRRGPGRPRKQAGSVDSLAALVDLMKQNERRAAAYRAALERVFELIGDTLGA